VLLLAAVAVAAPDAAPRSVAEKLRRWEEAGPEERRQSARVFDRFRRARRFSAARPVLIGFEGKTWSLAHLFLDVIEPALSIPAVARNANNPGLTEDHTRSLQALRALPAAFAPPQPVWPGTLNLLLEFGARSLDAPELDTAARLRFFRAAMRVVRQLDQRVAPDEWTRWIMHEQLLPRVLATAQRLPSKHPAWNALREAAGLLYMPSILDERAQARLAPLTTGEQSQTVLLRFYRRGALDKVGRTALARSVALQSRGDAAFLTSAPPLLLELLCDPAVAPNERGELVRVVRDDLDAVALYGTTARDLMAAALGGPPPARLDSEAIGDAIEKGAERPRAERRHRFLRVVLARDAASGAVLVASVVRVDTPMYEPLYWISDRRERRFVGVLLPSADGRHADFVGPPPGLRETRDRRLLRRRLDLERVSIRSFGPRGEETEISLTLPDDDREPVPARHADMSHVLALLASRAERTAQDEERVELVRLLARIGTDAAHRLAVRAATTRGALRELMVVAEAGHAGATDAVLARAHLLDPSDRERIFAAALHGGDGHRARILELCAHKDLRVAVLAADALLSASDAGGIEVLLKHESVYARACAGGLALRLTPLAGGVRVIPQRTVPIERLAAIAKGAFTKRDGPVWRKFGRWLSLALAKPETAREVRRKHGQLKAGRVVEPGLWVGNRQARPFEFAAAYTKGIREGLEPRLWPGLVMFLLDPEDPGRGLSKPDLDGLLDALEKHADKPSMQGVWREAWVALACAQCSIELDPEITERVHKRLARLTGGQPPPGAKRKPGLYWPMWAARKKS